MSGYSESQKTPFGSEYFGISRAGPFGSEGRKRDQAKQPAYSHRAKKENPNTPPKGSCDPHMGSELP